MLSALTLIASPCHALEVLYIIVKNVSESNGLRLTLNFVKEIGAHNRVTDWCFVKLFAARHCKV